MLAVEPLLPRWGCCSIWLDRKALHPQSDPPFHASDSCGVLEPTTIRWPQGSAFPALPSSHTQQPAKPKQVNPSRPPACHCGGKGASWLGPQALGSGRVSTWEVSRAMGVDQQWALPEPSVLLPLSSLSASLQLAQLSHCSRVFLL